MKEIMDFIGAAAPYVACGLMVAILAAMVWNKKNRSSEEGEAKCKIEPYALVGLIWYIVALLTALSNDGSGFTTYLCIGTMFLTLGIVEKRGRRD